MVYSSCLLSVTNIAKIRLSGLCLVDGRKMYVFPIFVVKYAFLLPF